MPDYTDALKKLESVQGPSDPDNRLPGLMVRACERSLAWVPALDASRRQRELDNEACAAIAAARSVDAAKDIADKAEALRVYARQAKNRALEIDAGEIRLRAERRLGEMLREQKATVGLARPGPKPKIGSSEEPNRPTLSEAGIDKKLSARAQKLAALPDDDFAWQLAGWRKKAEEEGERVSGRLVKGEPAGNVQRLPRGPRVSADA